MHAGILGSLQTPAKPWLARHYALLSKRQWKAAAYPALHITGDYGVNMQLMSILAACVGWHVEQLCHAAEEWFAAQDPCSTHSTDSCGRPDRGASCVAS